MAERDNANKSDRGDMTVSEAGRKGGETVRDKYGPEFYSEIGRKGGEHSHQGDPGRAADDDTAEEEESSGGGSSRRGGASGGGSSSGRGNR